MTALTPRMRDAFAAIRRMTAAGVPPTFEEIAFELDLASKSSAHRLVNSLQARGLIEYDRRRARSIRILGEMDGLEHRSTPDLRALRDRIEIILRARAQ